MNINDKMQYIKKNDVEYLSYQKLNDLGVVNAFTLRGLNFRNKEGLEQEYQKLFDALGVEYRYLVKPLAKHTDNVLIIDQKAKEDTADIHLDYLEGIDGLITAKKNIALATTSADCLCMILYDPVKKVLANVHSGWKGTFQKISQKALIKMEENFHCEPKDVQVFFMPAIRQCHFEVEDDVMLECRKIFEYTQRIEEIIQVGRTVNGIQKYQIDNILINKILLEERGVLAENIYDSEICSVCCSNKVNSKRAQGEEFEIATTIAMMKG